jgi:hypothetical protein
MALFGRNLLPHRSTLSRFLAALDQTPVEALRARLQEDLLARKPFPSPGGVFAPLRRAVDRGRCGWDPTSCPPTCAAATGVVACPSSPVRSSLRAGLSGAQTRRSGADSHCCAPGAYASVSGHVWWVRQWRLQRRIAAGCPGEHQLCDQTWTSPRLRPAAFGWPVWRRRPAHRCPDCWPWDDRAARRDDRLLELPVVKPGACAFPGSGEHPPRISGMTRALYDCPAVPLTPTGPEVRRARGHPRGHSSPPQIGVERDGTALTNCLSAPFPNPHLPPQMCLICICIAGRLKRCSPMRT